MKERKVEWGAPGAGHIGWLLIPCALLILRENRRRKAALATFADDRSLPKLLLRRPADRFQIRHWLFLLGVLLAVVAAARPRFGETTEEIHQKGLDLIVALDVSRSMLSEDIAPSRLERAKLDIQDVLRRLGGDRAGLVIFAGTASARVPLTNDLEFYRAVLRDVGPNDIPVGGTAIGDAIRTAVESFDASGGRERIILLITDGEDHESAPAEAAKMAAEKGIRIFSVGIGDSIEGARVPLNGDRGQPRFLEFEGQVVWSKLNEALLTEVARLTGGQYIPARTRTYDLGQILSESFAGFERSEYETTFRTVRKERFQWFLALALTCLLASSWPRRGA